VISTVEFMGSDEDEAALVSVPPYHIAGVSAVLTGIYGGRRIVHLPAFTPEAWVEAAAREEITHAMLVPTMLGRVLDVLEARGESLPRLRALSYGGGRMPAAVIERALRLLPHVDFVNAYGLTETSSTISVLSPGDHRRAIASEDPEVRRRLGSVGRPLPGLELEIRGPGGDALPVGELGEVYVRGEQVAGEYIDRKVIDDDGWFATKDSGWLDVEGYLFIDGRLDDVIVRGGENISPGEIEDVLRAHPQVADVAVIGVPDEQWGERVAAVIVAKGATPTPDELNAWVRERLRSTKTPQSYEFRSELPYNETGKLLRRVLKQELATSASAHEAAA
jgi:acyl-CoA synthetase (AMP-forming)/AMP-acid ligase II